MRHTRELMEIRTSTVRETESERESAREGKRT